MRAFTFVERDLEDQATMVMTLVVDFLGSKGYLTEEQVQEVSNNYAIVARKPSFFRRLLPIKEKKNELRFIIVRQETLEEPRGTKPSLKLVESDEKEP